LEKKESRERGKKKKKKGREICRRSDPLNIPLRGILFQEKKDPRKGREREEKKRKEEKQKGFQPGAVRALTLRQGKREGEAEKKKKKQEESAILK